MIVEALKNRLPEEYECDPVAFFGVNHINSIKNGAVDLFSNIVSECIPRGWVVRHTEIATTGERIRIIFESGTEARLDWAKSNQIFYKLESLLRATFSSIAITQTSTTRYEIDEMTESLHVFIGRISFRRREMVIDVGEGAFPAYDIVLAARKKKENDRKIALDHFDEDFGEALEKTNEVQSILSLINKLDVLRVEKRKKLEQLHSEVNQLTSAKRGLHNALAEMKERAKNSEPAQEEWAYVQERITEEANVQWSRAYEISSL